MNVGQFYALFSTTCFALVGLWWNVVDRRHDLTADPHGRRMAGGIYLSFFLPGVMGLFAQVSPDNATIWRTSFVVVSIVGAWSTFQLLRNQALTREPGVFGRNRWVVLVLYVLLAAVALLPDPSDAIGLTSLQVGASLLILLVVIGHGLTWELLIDRGPSGRAARETREAQKPEG